MVVYTAPGAAVTIMDTAVKGGGGATAVSPWHFAACPALPCLAFSPSGQHASTDSSCFFGLFVSPAEKYCDTYFIPYEQYAPGDMICDL